MCWVNAARALNRWQHLKSDIKSKIRI